MGVPEEIRKVPRPTNTVVVAYGKNKDKYAVKERVGCRSVGGRKLPVDGRIVGHIVNGRYVPREVEEHIPTNEVDIKDYGNILLCDHLFQDLLDSLRKVYCEAECQQIMCIAVLRACYPHIKDDELEKRYGQCFLSEMYPGVALSKNTVCDLLQRLGGAGLRIQRFLEARVEAARSKRLIVDGTLISDESSVNTLSNYSRKARLKKSRDISVIYAYDPDLMEPVCYKAYPGNMVDSRAFKDFIRENRLKNGIIVADKGFPPGSAKAEFAANPDLHYLIAVKNSLKALRECGAFDFDIILDREKGITASKNWSAGMGCWVYGFRTVSIAAEQERAYLARAGEDFDPEDLEEAREGFGVLMILSDLDLDPALVYKVYDERWIIEEAFRMYKDFEELDETRVHSDYSVYGTQFVNYLSTVLTCRLVKRFAEVEALDRISYVKVLDILRSAQRARLPDGSWMNRRMTAKDAGILADLGVYQRPIVPKSPRGRPRKRKNQADIV
ncbi:MAG: transposase [Thermoplasmata archaeon]|nr:transposase [Thermoplasmata archaeon]